MPSKAKPKPLAKWEFRALSGGEQTLGDRGYVSWYASRPKKDGHPGARVDLQMARYSAIAQCCSCGKLRRESFFGVEKRWFCYSFSEAAFGDKHVTSLVLCIGCYNKIRSIERTWEEAESNRLLIQRIKRKLNEATKNNARID